MEETQRARPGPYRCGYVALAGRPNVGKSTLLNALVGEHLSIVSPKAQTTRERVRGILTADTYQILFIDAPGLMEPEYALQEAMRQSAAAALSEADVITYVADATRPATLPDDEIRHMLGSLQAATLVVLNKCDLVDGATVVELARSLECDGHLALSMSAVTGEGLESFLQHIVPLLPESPPLFPEEDSATQPIRFFAQEFVRETCLDLFHHEIPYSIACAIEEFREEQDPVYIRATIYVERESQKGIVIGKGGAAIKTVGAASRRKIEELLGQDVYLDLRVKVMPGWRKKHSHLRGLGFSLPPASRGGHGAA